METKALISPSPRLRGEGRCEGQKLAMTYVAAPHPNPLPTEEWGEGTTPQFTLRSAGGGRNASVKMSSTLGFALKVKVRPIWSMDLAKRSLSIPP